MSYSVLASQLCTYCNITFCSHCTFSVLDILLDKLCTSSRPIDLALCAPFLLMKVFFVILCSNLHQKSLNQLNFMIRVQDILSFFFRLATAIIQYFLVRKEFIFLPEDHFFILPEDHFAFLPKDQSILILKDQSILLPKDLIILLPKDQSILLLQDLTILLREEQLEVVQVQVLILAENRSSRLNLQVPHMSLVSVATRLVFYQVIVIIITVTLVSQEQSHASISFLSVFDCFDFDWVLVVTLITNQVVLFILFHDKTYDL